MEHLRRSGRQKGRGFAPRRALLLPRAPRTQSWSLTGEETSVKEAYK